MVLLLLIVLILALLNGVELTFFHTCSALDTFGRVDFIRLFYLSGDGVYRTYLGAQGAALAEIFVDVDGFEGLAVAGPAFLIDDVLDIFVPEVFECRLDRISCRLAQTAEGCGSDSVSQSFQYVKIGELAVSGYDLLKDVQHSPGTFTAWYAFAA